MDPNIALYNLDKAHFLALTKIIRNYNYNNARGIMKLYYLSTTNAESAQYASVVCIVDGMKALKDSYRMVMLDGLHRHGTVKIVQNEDYVKVDFGTSPHAPRISC